MNKVILIGRLARDPELRYTQSGKAWARMTIAVDRRFGRGNGEQQPSADFISLVAWDKLAEICGNNLKKGRQISVEGRLQSRSYDAQDGSKRYVTEVVISEMEFLDSRGNQGNGGGAPYNAPSGGQPSGGQGFGGQGFGGDALGKPPVGEDDIPF